MNNSFEILSHRNKDKITPKAVNRLNKDSEREKQASSRDLRNSWVIISVKKHWKISTRNKLIGEGEKDNFSVVKASFQISLTLVIIIKSEPLVAASHFHF